MTEAICDYCSTKAPVRGTPYMADIRHGAQMCEECWKLSRETGRGVEEIDIGPFEKKPRP